jgi:hypothetical protein
MSLYLADAEGAINKRLINPNLVVTSVWRKKLIIEQYQSE